MRKNQELTNPQSCLSRARGDEMTFVLLGRDAAAPAAIRAWVEERVRLGKNSRTDSQILDALKTARLMELERTVKVFQMNDCDWVAATPTLEEAKAFYIEMNSVRDSEREELVDGAEELTSEDLDRKKWSDIEGEFAAAGTKFTFREALSLMLERGSEAVPFFFASTEY